MASLLFHQKTSVASSCTFLPFLLLLLAAISRGQTVPAIYVFGDSLLDVGNNNHLALSILKADFPYNGIDYPGKRATGRFSNGKNAADFIAEKLGLPTAPPYLSRPDGMFVKGVSFASGGAGIFNDTDETLLKHTIPLANQVVHFSTMRQRLVTEMESTAVQEHLSKSIFPVVIGNNDIINYFKSGSRQSSPQQYVTLMVSNLKELLKGIYGLGARKFLAIGLPPIGCAPKQRFQSPTNECNKEVNYWSKEYNTEQTQMLRDLKSELKGFQYTFYDTYQVISEFIQNPATYGFNETKAACCGTGKLRAQLPCTPIAQLCPNRDANLFWDIYHPTEAAARMVVDVLFRGSGNHVSPITVQQLIAI